MTTWALDDGPRNATETLSILDTDIHVDEATSNENSTMVCTNLYFFHSKLTFSVIPSSTNSSSVRSQVPVAVSLTSPVSGSTAYNGALPPRCSQICCNVTQPPRVVPSADSRYSRAEVDEYRIDTVVVASHSGLGMGSFGDGVSVATASLSASMLRRAILPRAFDILVIRCFDVRICAILGKVEGLVRRRCAVDRLAQN